MLNLCKRPPLGSSSSAEASYVQDQPALTRYRPFCPILAFRNVSSFPTDHLHTQNPDAGSTNYTPHLQKYNKNVFLKSIFVLLYWGKKSHFAQLILLLPMLFPFPHEKNKSWRRLADFSSSQESKKQGVDQRKKQGVDQHNKQCGVWRE